MPNTLFPERTVIEEKLDKSRILLRCRELSGGCGESLEILVDRKAKKMPESYIKFFRYHLGCKEATHE